MSYQVLATQEIQWKSSGVIKSVVALKIVFLVSVTNLEKVVAISIDVHTAGYCRLGGCENILVSNQLVCFGTSRG